ncbi:MAG: ABC transporter permease [Proteobacteria bacterium]|nr:ABC transporter permease [Pseudomonadota bacterium]
MTGADDLGWWGVLIAVIGGAIRLSTPYLFVSLGETLTEKGGRVNLGLEGILVMGAMSGYGIAVITGEPWLGVFVAGLAGASLALLHGLICNLPRVNDIAVGISLFVFGTGLAFFLGKAFIHPSAPRLPHLELGAWSSYPQVRSALEINSLFLIGMILAPMLAWGLKNTRWGLILRTVGDSTEAATALGYSVNLVRTLGTVAGGFLSGVGGSFLSLYYPGTWNEGLSSGQGLMAVALVIFARWNPIYCFYVSLLFGAATALGPALQTVGFTENYYLYGAAPYVLTLILLIYSSSTKHALAGAPSEVSISR